MEEDFEFIEEGHCYVLNGVILPSVSEILHFLFPDKYKNVSSLVLERKAEYGSEVHEYIEKFEKGLFHELPNLNIYQDSNIRHYHRLKAKHDIEVLEQEKMVHYSDKYAGRFDMIANVGGKESLCDIKTTVQLDKEYLSWQLSLYEFAYLWMNPAKKKFKKLYTIWLPKGKVGELVEIPRKSKKEILKVIKDFYDYSQREVIENGT